MKVSLKYVLLTIVAVVFVAFCSTYAMYVHMQNVQEMNRPTWYGMFQIGTDSLDNQTFLNIPNEDGQKSFYINSQSTGKSVEGTVKRVSKDYIALYADGKKYATLFYSDRKYYMIDDKLHVTKLIRTSDSVIVFN